MRNSIGFYLLFSTVLFSRPADFSGLTDPYFGQKPPGLDPVPFHSELFTKDREQHDLFFGPGGLEAVWAERDPSNNTFRFVWTRSADGIWSEPVVLPFSKEYFNVEHCLSPDGKRLFFASNRPAVPGGEAEKMPDIWMSKRTEDGWGEPQRLGPPINSPDLDGQPFFGTDENLYFMRQSGKVRKLMYSPLTEGASAETVPFGIDLFQEQVAGFCISPDNRIMVLHSRKEGGFGSWDLYASFKDGSGKWSELINLGNRINTEDSEGGASFSPDGKILFFSRERRPWWVDSRILDEIDPLKKPVKLFNAITGGDTALVRSMVVSDPSLLSARQEHDMTPLIYASSEGQADAVRLLIRLGADVSDMTGRGASSLLYASMFKFFDVVKILVESGADVEGKGQNAPIFKAIEFGTKETAEYLAEKGASIPVNNYLFHQAAIKGMEGIVEFMLNHGADSKSLNATGGTILHSAAQGNLPRLAEQGIQEGLDIHAKNRYGLTPLHVAAMNGKKEMVDWLIVHGAKVDQKAYTGKTAYAFAMDKGFQEIADLLAAAGARKKILHFMDLPGKLYFGLKEPGVMPEIFAPGIVTNDIGEHGAVAVTPKGDEVYWQAAGIKYIRKVDGKWTFPDTLEIFQRNEAQNPALSADGNRLYFHSRRPLEKGGSLKDSDLWFVERTKDGWSEPVNLGPHINSELEEIRPSVAANGNIYFSMNNSIYMSEYRNGEYQAREKLGPEINGADAASPCIARDESFLIFESRRPGGTAFCNLWVSFKGKDGWTHPIVLGEDVCRGMARFPGISPDGKFLFFVSGRDGQLDLYWVSADVIPQPE